MSASLYDFDRDNVITLEVPRTRRTSYTQSPPPQAGRRPAPRRPVPERAGHRRTPPRRRRRRSFPWSVFLLGLALFVSVVLVWSVLLSSLRRPSGGEGDSLAGAIDPAAPIGGGIAPMDVTVPDWVNVDLLPVNEWSRPGDPLEQVNGVVVHYVGNPGTTAQQNRSYFGYLADTHETYASSHFVVGMDGEVIQCVPLDEISYCSSSRNSDTIAIECCHPGDSGEFTQETMDSLKKLLNWLVDTYGLQREDVLRHYDVTGKECPAYYVSHAGLWQALLDSLTYPSAPPVVSAGPLSLSNPQTSAPQSGDWNLILVNWENPLDESFTVPELTQLSNGHAIDSRAYQALQDMMDGARAAGYQPLICSSYRTWDKQSELFNRKVNYYLDQGYSQAEAEASAAQWVARPGASEHQAGLAVDIVDVDYQLLDEAQENRPVQQWLMAHCAEYGFILRYPTGKSELTGVNYEPWHYRYVGAEAAQAIMSQGLCLEEYLGNL